MFKKISPNYHLTGGSSCGSGYPVTTKVTKGNVSFYEEVPCRDACPELGPPDAFSLEAQQKAGILIRPLQSDILPASGDPSAFINKVNSKLSKPSENDE